MKTAKTAKLPCLLLALTVVGINTAAATYVGRAVSPDGKNVIEVSVDGEGSACYRVLRDDKELVGLSKMGLRTAATDFTS